MTSFPCSTPLVARMRSAAFWISAAGLRITMTSRQWSWSRCTQRRDDLLSELVLHLGELLGELADVVVVHDGERRGGEPAVGDVRGGKVCANEALSASDRVAYPRRAR